MPRTETQLGYTSAAGTAYASIYTVPASTTAVVHLNVTNRVTSVAKLRAYVADTSWSSGEPSGTAILAAVAYDTMIGPGEVFQVTGFIMSTTNKLVVRSDTASSLDIIASGVLLT